MFILKHSARYVLMHKNFSYSPKPSLFSFQSMLVPVGANSEKLLKYKSLTLHFFLITTDPLNAVTNNSFQILYLHFITLISILQAISSIFILIYFFLLESQKFCNPKKPSNF